MKILLIIALLCGATFLTGCETTVVERRQYGHTGYHTRGYYDDRPRYSSRGDYYDNRRNYRSRDRVILNDGDRRRSVTYRERSVYRDYDDDDSDRRVIRRTNVRTYGPARVYRDSDRYDDDYDDRRGIRVQVR